MRRIVPLVLAACLAGGLLASASGPARAATGSGQPQRWNAEQIDLPPAQPAGRGGAGVVVAVLDTWIDVGHPDFGGRVLAGATCVNGPCTPGGVSRPDGCEAHGTHVAGIVASATYGVAPDATILPVRVLAGTSEANCSASSTDVADGVRWAAAHGARIINISLGTAYPVNGQIDGLAQAVDQVSAQGVLVVAAAGNSEAPVGSSYGQGAVVVAATGPNGALAGYSQRGAGVDFAAPGGDPGSGPCTVSNCVVSTWANGEYAALAGTSMAAPHVAGVAALLLGQDPGLTRAGILRRLESTARPLSGAGYGLIDAAAALGVPAGPASTAPPAPSPTPSRGQVLVPASRPTPAGAPAAVRRPSASASPRRPAVAVRPTTRRTSAPPRPRAATAARAVPPAHEAADVLAAAVLTLAAAAAAAAAAGKGPFRRSS